MNAAPAGPIFDHLLHLTDQHGTFEHACLADPEPAHGYCTDDMARVLIVAARGNQRTADRLADPGCFFLNAAAVGYDQCAALKQRHKGKVVQRWEQVHVRDPAQD